MNQNKVLLVIVRIFLQKNHLSIFFIFLNPFEKLWYIHLLFLSILPIFKAI